MKSLKCRNCVYPGIMTKRPFGFQCPSCMNTVDLNCVDIDLETYGLQESPLQVSIGFNTKIDPDTRKLIGFDLAEKKDQTVVLIGAGNSGVNTAALIASLSQLGYSVIQAEEAIKSFNEAVAMPENRPLLGEELNPLVLKPPSNLYEPNPTNSTPKREHGWYRQFENKRRWRK